MKTYKLKVSIMGIPKVYRIIDASQACTFDQLHEVIFDAFNRHDPHLYSFFITKKDIRNPRICWSAPEITHPAALQEQGQFSRSKQSSTETALGDVGLSGKDIFHYLFDFGDEWWHRIRVESVAEAEGEVETARVVKTMGPSPPQYMEYIEDDDVDDEAFDDEG